MLGVRGCQVSVLQFYHIVLSCVTGESGKKHPGWPSRGKVGMVT